MTIRKIIATTATVAATLGASLAIVPAAHAGTNEARTCTTYINQMGPMKVQANRYTTSCSFAIAAAKKSTGAKHFSVYSTVTHKTYRLTKTYTGSSLYITGPNGIEINITWP